MILVIFPYKKRRNCSKKYWANCIRVCAIISPFYPVVNKRNALQRKRLLLLVLYPVWIKYTCNGPQDLKKSFRKSFNTIQLARIRFTKFRANYQFNLEQWFITKFHYLISQEQLVTAYSNHSQTQLIRTSFSSVSSQLAAMQTI